MRRIVIVAASPAGVKCATRLKRQLPRDEINLIIPAGIDILQNTLGSFGKHVFSNFPNLELLRTRDIGILEAQSIMTDLPKQELIVSSPRGTLPIRFNELVIEVSAAARIPRQLQNAPNVFPWPLEGFASMVNEYDAALTRAVVTQTPILIVGKNIDALQGALIASDAGAKVVWLAPEVHDDPWLDEHLWQYTYKNLAGKITYISLPNTKVSDITWHINAETGHLHALYDTRGNEYQGSCVLWASPLIARHPILREDGFSLDQYGRIVCDTDELRMPIHLIGSGVAAPSAKLGSSALPCPTYAGGEEVALVTSSFVTANLSGEKITFEGVYGVRKASGNEISVIRAGYTVAGAREADLPAEHATVAKKFPEIHPDATVYMSLICHKETQTLIGIHVVGYLIPEAIVDGVFAPAFTALADGVSPMALRVRSATGAALEMLTQCIGILVNKLSGRVKNITPDELRTSEDIGADFFVLDLRSQTDWQHGSLKNAYNIPITQLKKRLQDEVPRFTPIVLVCSNSNDSYVVACKLAGLGATELYVLDGGMQLWPYSTFPNK